MTVPAIRRRRAQHARAVEAVRQQAAVAQAALDVRGVVLFGSYARGDFHDASDIDVLVIVGQRLPDRPQDRIALVEPRPELVHPVVWTVEEFADRLARRDPIAVEAAHRGQWVVGDPGALLPIE